MLQSHGDLGQGQLVWTEAPHSHGGEKKKNNLIDELKKSLKIRLYVKYNQNPYINRDKTQPLV